MVSLAGSVWEVNVRFIKVNWPVQSISDLCPSYPLDSRAVFIHLESGWFCWVLHQGIRKVLKLADLFEWLFR